MVTYGLVGYKYLNFVYLIGVVLLYLLMNKEHTDRLCILGNDKTVYKLEKRKY